MGPKFDPVISLDTENFQIPGVQIELDPDEAESLGAFEESALSEDDAWEANIDVTDIKEDNNGF